MASSIGSRLLARPRAAAATVQGEILRVTLRDGRELSVPVVWFDWLARASEEDRAEIQIVEDGAGLWWEGLDDGVSVPWLFGMPEHP